MFVIAKIPELINILAVYHPSVMKPVKTSVFATTSWRAHSEIIGRYKFSGWLVRYSLHRVDKFIPAATRGGLLFEGLLPGLARIHVDTD